MNYEHEPVHVDQVTIDSIEYDVKNVEREHTCYECDDTNSHVIGTAIAKYLQFDILLTDDLEETELEYKYGQLKSDGTYYYESDGTFITQDIGEKDVEGYSTIKAYDYMLKFNIGYESTLNYDSGEITIADVLDEICELAGVIRTAQTLANEDFIVDSNQFNDATCRDVLIAIAQISGTYATIENDILIFKLTDDTVTHTITQADYHELDRKRRTHQINIVALTSSDISGNNVSLPSDQSEITDKNYFTVEDNPFAYTREKQLELIEPLYNQVVGFGYTAFELEGQGNPSWKLGEKLLITDTQGEVFTSYLFEQIFSSPTGLESIIGAKSITKATVEYLYGKSTVEQAVKKTQVIVDQALAQITNIISEQTSQSEIITQMLQTLEGWGFSIESKGGVNMLENSAKRYGDSMWDYSENYAGSTIDNVTDAISKKEQKLGNGYEETVQEVSNGQAVISLSYRQNIPSNATLYINAEQTYVISLTATSELTEIVQIVNVVNNLISIRFECDTDNGFSYLDLMMNTGDTALPWQQSPNEVYTDTVRIGGGYIEIISSILNTKIKMSADNAFEIIDTASDEIAGKFDKNGLSAKTVHAEESVSVNKLRIFETSDGSYFININD